MKIFISSTVHDLKDLRRLLRDEFKRCGFDPVLSEIGNMGIESNQHTYDTCIKQAESCDVVVGIIDSRAGGIVREGVHKGKTITQAEMEAALAKGRLVYAFARGAITDAEPVYKKYMGGSEPIAFRATDNVVASEEVLTFIDSWRKKAKDNWITTFQDPGDIVRHVLRQLEMAGKHQGVLILRDLDRVQDRLIIQLQTVATNLNSLAGETNLDSSQGGVRSGMFQVFNDIVQRHLEHCTTELAKLSGGSVEVSGNVCVEKTKDCFSAASTSVLATSFPDHRIWEHGEGSDYLDCNRKALERGINVTRYFVFPSGAKASILAKNRGFLRFMHDHLRVYANAMSGGKGKYTIKLVNSNLDEFSWHGASRQQIPDISYFDHLVESEWTRRAGDVPSTARIALCNRTHRREVDALFDALDNHLDTKLATKIEDVEQFIRGRTRR